jgi:hypothetical protein
MGGEVQPVDQVLPIPRPLALGLQRVLVMYAGAVALPLIIGRALKLPPEDITFLINADLFACGRHGGAVPGLAWPRYPAARDDGRHLCSAVLLNAFFNGVSGSKTAQADAAAAASSAQHI